MKTHDRVLKSEPDRTFKGSGDGPPSQIQPARFSSWFRLFTKTRLVQALKVPVRFGLCLVGDAILMACFVLRPIVKIRFAHLASERIGSLIAETDYWHRRQRWHRDEANTDRNKVREINIFIASPHMAANGQLLEMMGRKITLLNNRIASAIYYATAPRHADNAHLHIMKKGVDTKNKTGWKDVELWENTEQRLIEFTDDELRKGEALLESLGIPRGEPYICFAGRDQAYLNAQFPPEEQSPPRAPDYWSYHDFRDFDIADYYPMAEHFASLGFPVLRMGGIVAKPIATENPRIIDNAWNHRSAFGDLYLLAHCKFFIGDTAGIFYVPVAFKVPYALANITPNNALTRGPGCLFMPRIYRQMGEDRLMHYREVFASGVEGYATTQKYADAGVELVANTPDEILAMAVELNSRIDETWEAEAGDDELQKQFWSCYPAEHDINSVSETAARKGYTNVAAGFLRQNRELVS